MDIQPFLYQMERNGLAIAGLVRDIPAEQATWRPDPDSWSILEVIYHLVDEEREDFRQRLQYVLNKPGTPFPPIDPKGWPEDRRYNERDLMTGVKTFVAERARSLEWLIGLENPAWENTTPHPEVAGDLSAAHLFSSWILHDFLHIRQINELLYAYTLAQLPQPHIPYEGAW